VTRRTLQMTYRTVNEMVTDETINSERRDQHVFKAFAVLFQRNEF